MSLAEFISWLTECSKNDEEDVHTIDFTTQDCISLLSEIGEKRENRMAL